MALVKHSFSLLFLFACVAVGVAFVLLRMQYTLSLTLRFVIILLPAALLKWFDYKSCAIYGTSRLISNSARSLPSGFLTQTPYTHLTLFSYRFFFLSFDFLRFSFFRQLLLLCSLFMPLYMVWKLVLLSSCVSTSLLRFDVLDLLHTEIGSKVSPLGWESVESCSFKCLTMPSNFSNMRLCSLMKKFNLFPSLGLN